MVTIQELELEILNTQNYLKTLPTLSEYLSKYMPAKSALEKQFGFSTSSRPGAPVQGGFITDPQGKAQKDYDNLIAQTTASYNTFEGARKTNTEAHLGSLQLNLLQTRQQESARIEAEDTARTASLEKARLAQIQAEARRQQELMNLKSQQDIKGARSASERSASILAEQNRLVEIEAGQAEQQIGFIRDKELKQLQIDMAGRRVQAAKRGVLIQDSPALILEQIKTIGGQEISQKFQQGLQEVARLRNQADLKLFEERKKQQGVEEGIAMLQQETDLRTRQLAERASEEEEQLKLGSKTLLG